jgi:hypothetical protein
MATLKQPHNEDIDVVIAGVNSKATHRSLYFQNQQKRLKQQQENTTGQQAANAPKAHP